MEQGVYSSSNVRPGTAYSRTKRVYQCTNCTNRKHVCVKADDTVSRNPQTLNCWVCAGNGSAYEQELYPILNQLSCIQAYAAEAHAVQGSLQFGGGS